MVSGTAQWQLLRKLQVLAAGKYVASNDTACQSAKRATTFALRELDGTEGGIATPSNEDLQRQGSAKTCQNHS